MINKILTKIFGSRNDRVIKEYQKLVDIINAKADEISQLSDAQLQEKTDVFKTELQGGKTLEDILPDAFAVVRESSKRVLGLYHHDVQLIGGAVLNSGNIAEMGTGEGKTLVATLPAYLNALGGEGVHIVTVNDYLARRDGAQMGKVFEFLGLSVGIITSDMDFSDKQNQYHCDIVYGTNNELGFDYLRDNMAFDISQKVQKNLGFAIVDEVDSILIDEARTPLIISGPSDDYSSVYQVINKFIPDFSEQIESGEGKEIVVEVEGDYTKDEKHRSIFLTDRGHEKAEQLLVQQGVLKDNSSLYDASNILLLQHFNAALKAHILYQNDVDYVVENDEVIIVDEFSGRKMTGRRWSEGLHQAIEAKEGVSIKQENQTLASITFQNYFRLYDKLSGMTGTADTEAAELKDIYDLEVVIVPPNKPSMRDDKADQIYMTMAEKFNAIVADVQDCNKRNQPVLIGTSSIETSEVLSKLLTQHKIKHNVLNAKQHQREAEIVAMAGSPRSVTIATNMAGRGTDIVLGGKQSDENSSNWQELHDTVLASGGLHIIGTERNESRRVDNQLRGRSGRQGDVGSTRFYLSLEDNLMRIFASERMASMMKTLGMQEGEAIEHKMINRAIENAQRKVETMNYDARKNLLEYDDVANDQRKVIYGWRDELISDDDVHDKFITMRNNLVADVVGGYMNTAIPEKEWDIEGLNNTLKADFGIEAPLTKWLDEKLEISEIEDNIIQGLDEIYTYKEELATPEQMRPFEKGVMLQTLDNNWKEHLASMDYLRSSIGLRGYAQKNPIQEYKEESFKMFNELLDNINTDIVRALCTVQINQKPAEEIQQTMQQDIPQNVQYNHQENTQTTNTTGKKIGRNEPCPCGSGKKYKQCCGKK
jgi:preprotein translocase subunit SecA